MENQLIELQSQFAFQEDMLQELNLLVVRQQAQIEALQHELKLHADKLRELSTRLPDEGSAAPGDDRPPHY